MSLRVDCALGSYVVIDPYPFVVGQEHTFTVHMNTSNHRWYEILHTSPDSAAPLYIVERGQEADCVLRWTVPEVFYNDPELSANGATSKFLLEVHFYGPAWETNSGWTNPSTVRTPPPAMTCSVADVNSVTTALTGDSNKLVRYASTARASIAVTARPKSTLTKITINGEASAASATRDYPQVGIDTFVFYAEDSRKMSVSQTLRPAVVPYIPLTAAGTAERPAPTGSTVNVSLGGNYWTGNFGRTDNTLTVTWSCTNGASGTLTPSLAKEGKWSGSIVLSADYQSSYMLTVTAVDKVGTVTAEIPVNRGIPVFDWGGKSFRVNVPLGLTGGLEKSALDLLHPVGSYYWSAADTSPAALFGGTWERTAQSGDYVVEESIQHKDGTWDYRKWASGLYEGWYRTPIFQLTGMELNEGGPAYTKIDSVDAPAGLTALNVVLVSVDTSGISVSTIQNTRGQFPNGKIGLRIIRIKGGPTLSGACYNVYIQAKWTDRGGAVFCWRRTA